MLLGRYTAGRVGTSRIPTLPIVGSTYSTCATARTAKTARTEISTTMNLLRLTLILAATLLDPIFRTNIILCLA